jgi:hypothetical protein
MEENSVAGVQNSRETPVNDFADTLVELITADAELWQNLIVRGASVRCPVEHVSEQFAVERVDSARRSIISGARSRYWRVPSGTARSGHVGRCARVILVDHAIVYLHIIAVGSSAGSPPANKRRASA